MKNFRRLTFNVSLTVPDVVSVYAVRDYIKTAVMAEGGQCPSDDPLFSVKNVKVKRDGDNGNREPTIAEPINLSALISCLKVIESQIRQKGSIPDDKPITVPVKVNANFGPFRHNLIHVTAKSRLVLLHYVKED